MIRYLAACLCVAVLAALAGAQQPTPPAGCTCEQGGCNCPGGVCPHCPQVRLSPNPPQPTVKIALGVGVTPPPYYVAPPVWYVPAPIAYYPPRPAVVFALRIGRRR